MILAPRPSSRRPLVALALVALAACHGGSSAPPTPPTIRDLAVEPRAVYAAPAPTTLTVRWQFDDPNGDVDAAVVTITDAANVVVDQQTFDVAAQSHAGSLLVSSPSVMLPDVGRYSVAVELTDRAGHRSNPLSQPVEVSVHPWSMISGLPFGSFVDVGFATLEDRIYAAGGVFSDIGPGLPPPQAHFSVPFCTTFQLPSAVPVEIASLSNGREGVAAVAAAGRVHAIGGFENTFVPGRFGVVGTVEAFDPVAGTWTQRAPMPTPRRLAAGALLGGVIVVVGGETAPPASVLLDTVEVYVPWADLWTRWPSMPRARSRCRAAAFAGKLWVAGGQNSALADETAVDVFDPMTGLWSTAAQTPGPATLLVELGGRLVAATQTGLAANTDPLVAPWHPLTACPAPIYETASATVFGGTLLVLRQGELWRYDPALELR